MAELEYSLSPITGGEPTHREKPPSGVDVEYSLSPITPRHADATPTHELTRYEQAGDVLKSATSGITRGVIGMPGILGDVATVADIAGPSISYYARRLPEHLGMAENGVAQRNYDEAISRINSSRPEGEKLGQGWNRIMGVPVPTSEYFVSAAEPYVPDLRYQGQTSVGRMAGTAGEIFGGAPVGGVPRAATTLATRGARQAVSQLGRAAGPGAAANLATGVGAGAGTEYLGDYIGEGPAGLLGGASGAASNAYRASRNASGVRSRGESVAGQALRDQLQGEVPLVDNRGGFGPRGTETLLERTNRNLQPNSADLVPGFEPTSTQLLGNEGANARALLLNEEARRTAVAQQNNNNTQALVSAAGEVPDMMRSNLQFPSLTEAAGLTGLPNPMASSSQAVRGIFDSVERPLAQAVEDAWKHPALSQAVFRPNVVRNQLQGALNQLGPAANNIPSSLRSYIDAFSEAHGQPIPLEQIQNARSLALGLLRNNNIEDRLGVFKIAESLENILLDHNAVQPRAMQGTTYAETTNAWDAARNATREYKRLINENPALSALAERHPQGNAQAGMPLIDPAATLDRVFGSRQNALENFEQLATLPGIDRAALNRAAGDWIVGKLTNDGATLDFNPNYVARFAANPQYREIINRIPGLSDRLKGIAEQSVGERAVGAFDRVLQRPDPNEIANYIRRYGRDMVDFLPPQQQRVVSQIGRSAELLRPFRAGEVSETTMTRFLEDGDLFTVLMGHKMGLGTKFLTGAAVIGLPAQIATGVMGAGVLGGMAGAGFGFKTPPQIASRLVFGDVQRAANAALARAARDPEYMRELLQKPSIENIYNPLSIPGLQQFVTRTAPNTAYRGFQSTRQSTEDEGRRPGRASGGRIRKNFRAKAQALINAADRAKKQHNGTTQSILDMPDEAVAKALSIADKAI